MLRLAWQHLQRWMILLGSNTDFGFRTRIAKLMGSTLRLAARPTARTSTTEPSWTHPYTATTLSMMEVSLQSLQHVGATTRSTSSVTAATAHILNFKQHAVFVATTNCRLLPAASARPPQTVRTIMKRLFLMKKRIS